jgi:hypothetical protein
MKSTNGKHDLIMAYTHLDDGIHLKCWDCDFTHLAGFGMSLDDAMEIQNSHRADILQGERMVRAERLIKEAGLEDRLD